MISNYEQSKESEYKKPAGHHYMNVVVGKERPIGRMKANVDFSPS